jgi:sodium/bile acid cotransporter 7
VSPVLLLVVNIVLLTSVMVTTAFASRRLGFSPRGRDRDRVLRFQEQPGRSDGHRAAPAATVGLTVLPLMLFHQIQLTVCASLARRYAARPVTPQPAELVRLVGVGISDRVVRVATPKRCKQCRHGNAG